MRAPLDATGVGLATGTPRRRIVSLIPSTTETLCALGLADALVGITVYCREPAVLLRDKTRIGGEKNPHPAKIRAPAPDPGTAHVEEKPAEHGATVRAGGRPAWGALP